MTYDADCFEARNAPWKKALAVVGAIVFVALGLWMVGAFGVDHPVGLKPLLAGWACIIFFGAIAIIGLRSLFDRSVVLRIDRRGIWSKRFSEATVPWSDITEVAAVKIQQQKMLGFKLLDADRFPRKGVTRLSALTNDMLLGYPLMIAVSETDRTFPQLEDAVARYLADAMDQPDEPPPRADPARPSFGRRTA